MNWLEPGVERKAPRLRLLSASFGGQSKSPWEQLVIALHLSEDIVWWNAVAAHFLQDCNENSKVGITTIEHNNGFPWR